MENERSQFRNYPLKAEELRQIYQENTHLDKQIRENDNEIRVLNGKIAKTDYQQKLLIRLKSREKILQEKKRQLIEIVQTQKYIEEQIKQKKIAQGEVKNNLANQYKLAMQQKKTRAELEKKRQIEMERNFQMQNMLMMQEQMKKKKQQNIQFKRNVQQELHYKEYLKEKEKAQQVKAKNEYNQKTKLLGIIQTEKQSSYKQYYNQFQDQLNRIHNIYENKIATVQNEKEANRNELIKKGIEQTNLRNSREYGQKLNKILRDREQLKNALQKQIQQKQMKKYNQKEQHKKTVEMSRMYSIQNNQLTNLEKLKKKQQQKRYEQNLTNQVKFKESMYNNPNQSSSSPKSIPLHNPITNPIDFKIGITNPYILQTYQNTKQKYLHQNNGLKLRNLAMIANKSLGKWNPQE